jgi:hypothetical protein
MSRELSLLMSGFLGKHLQHNRHRHHRAHQLVSFPEPAQPSRSSPLTDDAGLEFWFATFIPIPLVDRVGRRPLLLIGAAGQCVSMVMIAAMIAYPGDKIKGYVAVVFLLSVDSTHTKDRRLLLVHTSTRTVREQGALRQWLTEPTAYSTHSARSALIAWHSSCLSS